MLKSNNDYEGLINYKSKDEINYFNKKIHRYITEIKRKYGVDMQSSRLVADAKHVNCPIDKANAIIDALKHFNII